MNEGDYAPALTLIHPSRVVAGVPLESVPFFPRTAIILAAGMGTRLREVQAAPKGLLELGGEALVERALRLLASRGVVRAVLVTGWQAEAYAAAVARWRGPVRVELVYNEDYETTGSLSSLALAVPQIEGAAWVVESDLVFAAEALDRSLACGTEDVILASGPTGSGDEVWIEATPHGCLLRMGKIPGETPPVGELVGVNRFAWGTLRRLAELATVLPAESHYEDGLNALAEEAGLEVCLVPNLAWGEIDQRSHLERVQRDVWPRLEAEAGGGEARPILLTPGPLTTSLAVKRAAAAPDVCPRERDFGAVVQQVQADLLAVAAASAETHAAILIGGPGTAAVEAALGSIVPDGGRLLVLNNGAYGERARRMAQALRIPVEAWQLPWTEVPDVAAWRAKLAEGGFTHAFWVHHETTTGLLNPLVEFGAACREAGVVSIVDAMSSFAGVEVAWGREPIDVLISSANKCLQGLPGVGFVIARRAVLADSREVRRSVALDLHAHQAAQESTGEFPFTVPVPAVRALAVALTETRRETVAGRAARYAKNYDLLIGGLQARGFEPLLPEALHSKLLTALREPDWPEYRFASLHDDLLAAGITIYPGKVPGLASFRVGHIGDLHAGDQAAVLAAVDRWRIAAREGLS